MKKDNILHYTVVAMIMVSCCVVGMVLFSIRNIDTFTVSMVSLLLMVTSTLGVVSIVILGVEDPRRDEVQ